MKAELLALLYAAKNAQLGTVIETNNPEGLRQKLYALRREYEPEFEQLSFLISPLNKADLWILNKEQPNGQE